jgi:predicted RNA methylase
VKIADDIAQVLRAARFEGERLVLTGQLDRKAYARVNDVIEELGGQWKSGRVKAHVFKGDARAIVDAALGAGEITTAAELGWFPTPDALARDVIEAAHIGIGDEVLEPSAGEGALVRPAQWRGALVTAVEVDAKRAENLREKCGAGLDALHVADFLTLSPSVIGTFDSIVMNPPFSLPGRALADVEHVERAFTFLRPGGRLVAIMSAGITFRSDRRSKAFRATVAQHDGHIEELPEGSFKTSGTNVRAVLVTMRGAS